LVPNNHTVEFFFEACKQAKRSWRLGLKLPSIGYWVQQLTQKSSGPDSKLAQTQLTRLCKLITVATGERKATPRVSYWPQTEESVFSDDLLGKVVEASLQLRNLDLLYDAVSAIVIKLPLEKCRMIGNAVQCFGFAEMQKMWVLYP
jgi:hypothetical protein